MVRLWSLGLVVTSSANLVPHDTDSSTLLQLQQTRSNPTPTPKAAKLLLEVQAIASNIHKNHQDPQDPVRQCQGGWQTGSGVGGSEQSLGQAASQDACVTMVREQCNGANGATFEPASGSCICETGQTDLDASVTESQNCAFFADGSTDENLRTAVDALDDLVDSIVQAMDVEHTASLEILNTAFSGVTTALNLANTYSAERIEELRLAAEAAVDASDECAASLVHWTDLQAQDCPAWESHVASLSSCSNACPCQSDPDTFFSAFEVWEGILANGGGQQIRDLRQACDDANAQVAALTTSCPTLLAEAHQAQQEYGDAAAAHLQHCSSFAGSVEAYLAVEEQVTIQLNQRRSEYEILQQVKCYIDAIEDTSGLTDQGTTQCAATQFDGQGAARYVMTFNTVPEAPTCLNTIQAIDGVLGCVPLLLNYQLGNQANAPSAPPLNTGSFTSIRAVAKSGAISCSGRSGEAAVWQQCCGDSYSSTCGAGFELVHNGQRVIEQPSWGVMASQCEQPASPGGDLICHQDLQVAPADELIVTWYEPSRQSSASDNTGDMVVDLMGCNEPIFLTQVGFEYFNTGKVATGPGELTKIGANGWDGIAWETRTPVAPTGNVPRGISFMCPDAGQHVMVGLQQAGSDAVSSEPDTWGTASASNFKHLYDDVITNSCTGSGCAGNSYGNGFDAGFYCDRTHLRAHYSNNWNNPQLTGTPQGKTLTILVDGNQFKWFVDGNLVKTADRIRGVRDSDIVGPLWVVVNIHNTRAEPGVTNIQYITAPGVPWSA